METNFEATRIKHIESIASINPFSVESFASLIISALKNGQRVFVCGNGGSAADAQHFAAELVGSFGLSFHERRPLPAISLTTDTSILTSIANDCDYKHIFSRQIQGLGEEGDILICLSTSGRSENVVRAAGLAKEMGLIVLSITQHTGCPYSLSDLELISNLCIRIKGDTARIQEGTILVLHYVASMVDQAFKEN